MKQVILNHYGFSRLPFGKDIDPQQIFPSASLAQGVAMLELGLESEDLMLLTGPIGCGKSTVLRKAISGFDSNRYQILYLRGGLSGPSELFKLVLLGLKVNPPHSVLKAKPLFFSTVAECTRKPVIVLDDAQDAAPGALLALKIMTNFDADSSNRITFILAGQPELATVIGYSQFDSLRGRIRLSHHLAPMSLQETCAYIDHGLKIAHREEKLFSDEAKIVIFKRTGGIARQINTLCYQTIVRAATEQKHIIDTDDIPDSPF